MFPIIETERLFLRNWKDSDIPAFAAMNADPVVMEYFPKALDHSGTLEFVGRIRARFEKSGYGLYAAELKADSSFIGFIGFSVPSFESFFTPCVEIGWRLRREVWGRGLAPEGAGACLKYGFEELGFDSVCSFTSAANLKSIRVMEKIGLVKEGEFDHPAIAPGSPLRRHVLYRITRELFGKSVPDK